MAFSFCRAGGEGLPALRGRAPQGFEPRRGHVQRAGLSHGLARGAEAMASAYDQVQQPGTEPSTSGRGGTARWTRALEMLSGALRVHAQPVLRR